MTGEQKPGGLDGEGLSTTYRFAYESIRKGAPGLSDTTCMAIARSINMKVSAATIPAETRVRELERELAQANANGAAHWGRATAAEAKLARSVEGLERIVHWRVEMTGTPVDTEAANAWAITFDAAATEASQTLAAIQQEGE